MTADKKPRTTLANLKQQLLVAAGQVEARDSAIKTAYLSMVEILNDVDKIMADAAKPTIWTNCEERIIELDQALHNLVDEFPNTDEPIQPRSSWAIFARRLKEAKVVLGD